MAMSVFKKFLLSITVSIFVLQTHAIAYFPFTDDEERGSSGGILSGILILIVCVIASYFRLIKIIDTNRNIQSYADNFKKEGFFYDIVMAIVGDLLVSFCLSIPVLLIIRLFSGPEDARTAWVFINFLTFILLLYLSRFCWKVRIKQYPQHFKQLKLVSGAIILLAIISAIALCAIKSNYSKINLPVQTAVITPTAPIQTYSNNIPQQNSNAGKQQSDEVAAFIRKIEQTHPDARQLLPELEKWIKTQPESIMNRYNWILDNGSAEDVIGLYSVFKKLTSRSNRTKNNHARNKVNRNNRSNTTTRQNYEAYDTNNDRKRSHIPLVVNKPIEFSDLSPSQQSSIELSCFESKVKGKYFFDECIKVKLSAYK